MDSRNTSFEMKRKGYFTHFTCRKATFYISVFAYLVAFTTICIVEPFLPDSMICDENLITPYHQAKAAIKFANPSYEYIPCREIPLPSLLWINRIQASFGRRLLSAVLLGGLVGWERREADRPAGIRTMSLVSLGACLFSINSMFSFLHGPMAWDASRVSAAIPSGVGFLGAGLIFKQAEKDELSGDTTHVVHGLTTAASLWISAAVGVACAGELYFAASFAVSALLILLRFGPRQNNDDDDDTVQGDEDEKAEPEYGSSSHDMVAMDPELQPLRRPSVKPASTSIRKRAALGGIV